MENTHHPHVRKMIAKYLVPYVVLLIIPLLLGFIIYYKMVDVVKNDAITANRALLAQGVQTLDQRLKEIESITRHIAKDPKVLQLQYVQHPFRGTNTFRIIDTKRGLYDFSLSNNFISLYFIMFKRSGLVVGPSTTFTMAAFYEQYLRYPDLTYDEWLAELVGEFYGNAYFPMRTVELQGRSYSMVTHVRSLGNPDVSQGAVVVLIDEQEIRKLMDGVHQEGGWAYVADTEGRIVSRIGDAVHGELLPINFAEPFGYEERSIGDEMMSITYAKSAYTGWMFVAAQPTRTVMEKAVYIKRITLAVAVVSLLLGIAAAVYLAYRNSVPLRRLLGLISERIPTTFGPHRDTFGLIQRTLTDLLDNNETLKQEIRNQQPMLRSAILDRLLKGEIAQPREADHLLRHVGLTLQGSAYTAAIFRLSGYDRVDKTMILEDLDHKRVLSREMLRGLLQDRAYLHDWDEDKIVILYRFRTEQLGAWRTEIRNALHQCKRAVEEKLHVPVMISLGSIRTKLTELSGSFEEAKLAMDMQNWKFKDWLVCYDELPPRNDSYVYPAETEIKLVHLTKMGDVAGVERILGELRVNNFHHPTISLTMLKLFLCELSGTAIRLLDKMRNGEGIGMLDLVKLLTEKSSSYDGLVNVYMEISGVFRRLAESAQAYKKSQNTRMISRMIAYIEQHYADESLGVAQVADHFNLSEAYVSQFFKEQTGGAFSGYVELLRMKRAEELLADSELSVHRISRQIGYSSSNTFCRAFKRSYGISPLSFRNSISR